MQQPGAYSSYSLLTLNRTTFENNFTFTGIGTSFCVEGKLWEQEL